VTHGRAIVVGAGFAGSLVAAVLADQFAEVIMIERDKLPGEPGFRSGTPQTRHAHALLAGGRAALATVLPGLAEELHAEHGAFDLDWGADFAIFASGTWMPREPTGVISLACGRELLEHAIRRRVLALAGVTVTESATVTGLRLDGGTREVTGVIFRTMRSKRDEFVPADLVIDASGRGSRASGWLTSQGLSAPKTALARSHRGYASRLYRKPVSDPGWKALLHSVQAPDKTRGAVVYPVDASTWYVTLVGAGRDYPPVTQAGWEAFVRDQPTPTLREALDGARPLTMARGWRHTDSRIIYPHLSTDWPENLILIGDAVCALNPVYAQGMSLAAVSAVLLRDCFPGRGRGFARAFHRQLATRLADAVSLALAEDLRWPCTTGMSLSRRLRALQALLDDSSKAAASDAERNSAYLSVWHLLQPILTLTAGPSDDRSGRLDTGTAPGFRHPPDP
jgi:flavin-dependent dehydrogenase